MSSAQRAYSAVLKNSTAVACILLGKSSTSDRLTCSHCSGSEPSQRVASDRDGDVSGNSGSSRRKRARSDPANPCEEFNTLKWRLSYASRRDDCNAVPSCVFIGRSITGACAPRDPSLVQEQEEKQTASRALPNVPLVLKDRSTGGGKVSDVLRRQDTARRVKESMSKLETEFAEEDRVLTATRIAEVMDALDIEESTQDLALAILKEDGMQAVREFIKGQLVTAAAEELRLQETATHNFAKEFLIQVLQNDDLPGKMGQVLESIFRDPDISTGTRHLIYTAIGLEQTFRNALWLTRDQVTWLLTGTDWMDDEATKLCAYLVQMDHTLKATVPLVAWSIKQPDVLEPPAARALASSLPYGSEKLEESMIWAATRTLESEWALDLATTTLKAILVPPKPEADAATKSAPRTSPESGVEFAGDGTDAAAPPVDGGAETESDPEGEAGTVEQAGTDVSDEEASADDGMGPRKPD